MIDSSVSVRKESPLVSSGGQAVLLDVIEQGSIADVQVDRGAPAIPSGG